MKSFASVLCYLSLVAVLSAQDPPDQDPPARVAELHARVQQLRGDVELIRVEMGRPKAPTLGLRVQGSAPREIYALTLALRAKTERLAYEQLRMSGAGRPEPPAPDWTATFSLLDDAGAHLEAVMQRLAIPETAPEPAPEAPGKAAGLDEVFLAVLQLNRQINRLLDRRFAPRNVFEKVTQGVNYGAVLLAEFEGAVRLPEAPPFVRGKRPADVYHRLINCYTLGVSLLGQAGKTHLKVDASEVDDAQIVPSDVYDLSNLLLAELRALHALCPGCPAPVPSYDSGYKLPSHVFQRAGMLQAQLEDLRRRVQEDPDWLTP